MNVSIIDITLIASSIVYSKTRCSRRRQTSPPSAATWRTIRKNVFCDSVLFGPLFENMTPSTDLKYITYCIAPGEHQATATGNVYKKLMKFGLRFLSRYAGGQTDRHGDTLLAVLFAPNGGEMKQHNQICIQLSITYRPMDGLLHSS